MKVPTLNDVHFTIKHSAKHLCYVAGLSLVMSLSGCVTVSNAPKPNPKKAAQAHASIAAEYVKRNQLDMAKKHAQIAIDANSEHAPAQNIMAIILQREGSRLNVIKAEQYFKRAIALQKNYAQAHNNYGVYLSLLNRNKEALQQFEIAGATLGYANRASALENLGRTALKAGQLVRAEAALKQALEINRHSAIARIELVDIFIQKGRLDDAQRLYQDYVNSLGGSRQGARTLWQGIRLSKAQKDTQELQRLGKILLDIYPESVEAKRYQSLQNR